MVKGSALQNSISDSHRKLNSEALTPFTLTLYPLYVASPATPRIRSMQELPAARHPQMTNCGLKVEEMNMTASNPDIPFNIHFVACHDCHTRGIPARKTRQGGRDRLEVIESKPFGISGQDRSPDSRECLPSSLLCTSSRRPHGNMLSLRHRCPKTLDGRDDPENAPASDLR